jgi:alpha,alpha-trehalase
MKKYFFIEDLNPLYEDVQSAEIFSDSKFFVDCIPKFSAEEILNKYAKTKSVTGFDLKLFINENFILPAETSTGYESASKPITQHLEDLWEVLKREPVDIGGTLIPLPHSYIVPGGRFREIYYWDSYFTMLGLQVSKRVDIIQNMVDNFAYLINEVGFIPNGNRTYYLGRSQPPFFALMVNVLAEEKGEKIFLQYQSALEKEYAFWMDGSEKLNEAENTYRRVVKLPDGNILNRFWDDNETPRPEAFTEDIHIAKKSKNNAAVTYKHIRAAAESGWDFSSRWFADGQNMETIQTTNLIPVDLNCLMLNLETILLKIYSLAVDELSIQSFQLKIINRKKAIQDYCWNESNGFYFDYNLITKTNGDAYTLAAVYPLFFNVAESQQAEKVATIIKDRFLYDGGLITTIYKSGQQWDAPNGWAPLQWMAYKGFQNYGLIELANQIKNRWINNCEKVYNETGKMMEKYNVMDTETKAGGGEYPNQDGFGWTNGVYLKMKTIV